MTTNQRERERERERILQSSHHQPSSSTSQSQPQPKTQHNLIEIKQIKPSTHNHRDPRPTTQLAKSTHEPIGPIEAQSATTHEQIELQDIEETHGHTIKHSQPKPMNPNTATPYKSQNWQPKPMNPISTLMSMNPFSPQHRCPQFDFKWAGVGAKGRD